MGNSPKDEENNKNYFVPIRSQSEKKRILEALVASANPLVIKASDDISIHAVARRFTEDEMIACQYHVLSPTLQEDVTLSAQAYIVNFSVNKEEYFFQSHVAPIKEGFLLATQPDLYHLQRRRAIRLKLPLQMGAKIKVLELNTKPYFEEGLIIDFSTGGLRITLKAFHSKIKLGDELMLSIGLGKRIPFSVDAVVRYSAIQGDYQTCGIEFINKTSLLDNKLHALQLDMQSEIFRRWSKLQTG